MFCPKCGREWKGGLCVDCYLKDNPISLKPVEIKVCDCGMFSNRGLWTGDVLSNLGSLVSGKLHVPHHIKLKSVDVVPLGGKRRLKVKVTVRGDYAGEAFETVFESNVPILKVTCPSCAKLSGGYFEAILQVRTPKIKLEFKSEMVSNVEKVRGGYDVYMTSNSYARGLATQFRRRGFKVTSSPKLFGKKDGRDVYRVSYSIKDA